MKWMLPAGPKSIGLWLNQDPKEYREAEVKRIDDAVKVRRQQQSK